jgi:hypothetical protein
MNRSLPAILSLSVALALAACQSPEKKAEREESMVGTEVERVCLARADVDSALATVAGLTPQSTVGEARSAEESLKKALKSLDTAEAELSKAAVAEYRDQVKIFRDAVEDVRRQKDLTLEEAAEQLKGKAAPVIAAREQLDATIECPAADDAN